MKQVFTVGELVKYIEENYSNPKALNSYENDKWISHSSFEFTQEVKYLALGLKKLGIKRTEKIALIALPSTRWSVVDFGIMASGAVTVAIFSNISEENFIYETSLTEAKTIFVSGEKPWQRIETCKDKFEHIISLDDDYVPEYAMSYHQIIEIGKALDLYLPAYYQEMLDSIQPEDTAAIIFTSGSTGIPKGAEHTHYGLFSLLHLDHYQWDQKNDVFLSVLPPAHVFGRTINTIMIAWGITIYYYNDLKNLGGIAREVHPTILTVVPRILEKVYNKLILGIEDAGYVTGVVKKWAFELANQEEETTMKHIMHPLAESLVYSHVREALGGKLRVVFCGGAALDPHLAHFFNDVGLPIYEGWGLTEACPITVNRFGKLKFGTIGLPIDTMEVKIDNMGEIIVRGPLVMKGYYKNKAATEKAIDENGWLHTGDKGSVDAEGYFKIIGRFKELVKTSTGEMIAPIPIEQALAKSPIIDMAIVIADRKKFVSCLLVPDFDKIKLLKENHDMTQISDEEFLNSSYMKHEMDEFIDELNHHLNHWEQIRAYRFIPNSLTIDSGELTPSMKIVRERIDEKYKDLIDSMYKEEKK